MKRFRLAIDIGLDGLVSVNDFINFLEFLGFGIFNLSIDLINDFVKSFSLRFFEQFLLMRGFRDNSFKSNCLLVPIEFAFSNLFISRSELLLFTLIILLFFVRRRKLSVIKSSLFNVGTFISSCVLISLL